MGNVRIHTFEITSMKKYIGSPIQRDDDLPFNIQ
nr:MAG TPA: hypothetical protein [Caudoviricetes sp.]